METLALASSLAGVGYYLNNNNARTRDVSGDNMLKQNTNLKENIYNKSYYNTANQTERNLVQQQFNKSSDPTNTNVIPKYYNDTNKQSTFSFRPETTRTSNHRTEEPFMNYSDYNNSFKSLSGENIPMSQFTHNNMQPYFKGRVTQNTTPNANRSVLELFTGTSSHDIKKEEIGPLFSPTKNITNINGSSVYADNVSERFVPSRFRQGEKVIQDIHVGPGLNDGYTAEPSGGFQQADMRDFVLPKDTNELRTLNNPKLTYKGHVISGSGPKQRGLVNEPCKYKPDKFYSNTPERYFVTVASNKKPQQQPDFLVKDTNRQNEHESYVGVAVSKNPKHIVEQNFKQSTKQQLEYTGYRNANGQFANQVNDYGKEGILYYSNERDTTQNNNYIASAVSMVKALIAPIEDVIKTSKKENFIGNNRQAGNVQLPIKQLPVHDPNDIARTTIKETNIHNNHTGHLSGPTKMSVHDPNDIARTTMKETNIHNNHTGYLSGHKRITVYDPNDIARTTIKETNIHNERLGNMSVYSSGFVKDTNDITRTTGRETLPVEDTNRNLSGIKKSTAYDPNLSAKTTLKETTIDNNYLGIVDNRNSGAGYLTNPKEAPTTIRETTEDNNYIGDAIGKMTGAYQVTEYDAKATQREDLSDNSYVGNANNQHKKPISLEDMHNAEFNVVKEKIAEGREPTISNVKLTIGGDDVNMDSRKIELDEYNTRDNIVTKIVELGPEREDFKITKDKFEYEEQGTERINPEYLKAFRDNPYTKPLDSTF